ncbi:hypothetical protein ACOME3_002052 [Neoechinorhynchus agilis]
MSSVLLNFAEYLIPQLTLELLDFAISNQLECREQALRLKYELSSRTSMIDLTIETYSQLYPKAEIPTKLNEVHKQVQEKYSNLSEELSKFVDDYNAVTSGDEIQQGNRDADIWFRLKTEFQYDASSLDRLFEIALFSLDCGRFDSVNVALKLLECILPSNDSRMINILWGKLSIAILHPDQTNPMNDLRRLIEYIEKVATVDNPFSSSPESDVKQLRMSLCHWAMNLYQFTYLFTYVATAAVIIHSRKHSALEELVNLYRTIHSPKINDPINRLLKLIFIHHDFDQALIVLKEAEKMLNEDYFMSEHCIEFVRCARILMFDNFCKLHHTIAMDKIATLLDMSTNDAEVYISELVQEDKLFAKMDLSNHSICMHNGILDPYKIAEEKLRHITPRIIAFTNLCDRKRGFKYTNRDISPVGNRN